MSRGILYDKDDKKNFYGNIGQLAFTYKDENYFIGDIVTYYRDWSHSWVESIVVNNSGHNFIMWIGGDSSEGNIQGMQKWKVKKVKSYSLLKNNDIYCGFIKVKLLDINKRIKE